MVVVDLKRMARIRHLDDAAPSVEVEAGRMGVPLEQELARAGLTLGHFPSSILCSTVGGWVAARSAGQCSGAYGKIEDMVAALECVTGRGDVTTLRRRASGPDLVPLVVGSEGTLAIVTSATLRLHPAPSARAFGAWTFKATEQGWEAMRAFFQAGLRPAVARLYDPFDAMLARQGGGGEKARGADDAPHRSSRGPGLGGMALRAVLRKPQALNDLLRSSFSSRAMGGAMLVVIFEGAGRGPQDALERAQVLAGSLGGRWDGEAPARRWLAHRYAVSYRQAPVFAQGAFVDTMEVAACWGNLRALYEGVRRALGRSVFVMAHFSHAYPDGCCIYFSFVGRADPARVRELGWDAACEETYDLTWKTALAAAIDAGGTLSHHHGVGRSKAPRLRQELGEGADVVRSLMRAFDTRGVLNPGNLLPPEGPPVASFTLPHPAGPLGDDTPIDATSLLVCLEGTTPLATAEHRLREAGLTLDVAESSATVADWLAAGAPGARDRWLDPTDQLVAGFDATLRDGRTLRVRPTPRRAVGPDLSALFIGAAGRFGRIDRAWLRVHRMGVARPTCAPFVFDRDPPVSDGERALLDAISREATPTGGRP
jgi:alkyldihydroxyacetonephosphate synthase